jgi:hypothetical protein
LKRRQPNSDLGELKLAGLHPNLNYVLTFEMILKVLEGNEQCTVNSGVFKTGV